MSDGVDPDNLTRLSCHFDSMLWTGMSLWAAAVGGLLLYSREHFDTWLAISGLGLSVCGMFFAFRFRSYRRRVHNSMPKDLQNLLTSGRGIGQWDVLALIVLWLITLWARVLILNCRDMWPLWLVLAIVAAALVGIMWTIEHWRPNGSCDADSVVHSGKSTNPDAADSCPHSPLLGSSKFEQRGSGVPKTVHANAPQVGLMDILYGLAIATGFEDSIVKHGSVFEVGSPAIMLIIGALLLSVADWAVYHFIAGRKPYRGVGRFAFDLAFPLLLFVIFMELPNGLWFSTLVSAYFLASIAYVLIIGKSTEIKRASILAASTICLVFVLLGFFQARDGISRIPWTVYTMVSILLWSLLSGALIHWDFRGRQSSRLFTHGVRLVKWLPNWISQV